MNERALRLGWLLIGCTALGACHAHAPSGFSANTCPTVSAGYIRPLSSGFMPPTWELDNCYAEPATHEPRVKPGPQYHVTYELDGDGDGSPEIKVNTELYELRFVQAQLQATLWLRAFPVSRSLQNTDLDVLLKDYVEEVSHVGYEAVRFDTRASSEPPRYATIIAREVLGKLANLDAVDADVDVADREQLHVNQATSWRRMRLILARGPNRYEAKPGQAFPMMIVLAYAARPEHFAEADPDFEDILARFSIGAASGFVPIAWPHGPPNAPPLPNFAPPPAPAAR